MAQTERLRTLLSRIYGTETGEAVLHDLAAILERARGTLPAPARAGLSERDAILITYADQVQEPGRPGLASLADFCERHLSGLVSGIHILPFFPWSSDDGFSVEDYEAVEPQYGTWEDISRLDRRFRLMFDAVLNHASAEGTWLQGFLRDDPDYRGFFIEVNDSPDLSAVVRPRALPLLTEFKTIHGVAQLWTTFSPDQVDLNYHNPRVLLRMVEVMLLYVREGAEFLRLDAIAYLWKEPGTSCISLPQTHWIVQLLRAILDEIAPHVMLVTETNVPNRENLSYFGDGSNEAQMVYNFPLPPLVLHATQTGNAGFLCRWAAGLQLPSSQVTFLNFLASHDGIGLNPARGILPESEIDAMASRIETAGGFISYKSNPGGTQSPYEMNVNYFDALDASNIPVDSATQVERFVTAHAILLAFQGVPALYFHSLFGSRGWPAGVQLTAKYRTINREKLERAALEAELAQPSSRRSQVFGRLARLLQVRAGQPCFSPWAVQRVLESPETVFALLREDSSRGSAALCLHNVTRGQVHVQFDLSGTVLASATRLQDLVTGRESMGGSQIAIDLAPYQTAWLVGATSNES